MSVMSVPIPESNKQYIIMARGNCKSITSFILYCKSLGMTDDEIMELMEEAGKEWRKLEE